MSFLYPLFLVAGLSLAIPILIHLFNLRRYKVVMFPSTRFLKTIQLKSQKQSQLKYKWLLALRLLFLASLILAFAQPFFNSGNKKDTGNRLQVIYIDNSGSMGVKKGARTLFEVAREAARKQVLQSPTGSRFVILTNDKPLSYQPQPADKVLTEMNSLDLTGASKSSEKIFATIQSILQSESVTAADVYYYSDFQESTFAADDKTQLKNIRFYGIPVQSDAAGNVYIDTAYIDAPVLQSGMQNKLVVRSRIEGSAPKEAPVLQLSINGQVKSAATLNFDEKNERTDTLAFQVSGNDWQHIVLNVNDAAVRFDDTFRIAARSAPSLSVLVLNESQESPYIQAAFSSYNGFQLTQQHTGAGNTDWTAYNLVILNGITHIDKTLGAELAKALQNGLSICIFPAKTSNYDAFNNGLQQVADIRFTGLDTATQTVASLQQGSDLVRDMFESIPENVQLPTSNWHYVVDAGISANQQAVLSFRNGAPFLARYSPSKGQLYICASSADLDAGNFSGSYFFVPFLYQMAMQSRGGDMYALTLGRQQPAFVPFDNAGERNMIHIKGNDIDVIPAQRPAGKGLDIFVDPAVQQPGFYTLTAAGTDTAVIALNSDRTESKLATWKLADLKNRWKDDNIYWLDAADTTSAKAGSALGSFPLWKVCAILAVLMLTAETFLLAGGFRKQSAATQ